MSETSETPGKDMMLSASLADAILEGTPPDIIERYGNLVNISKTADFGEYDENVVVIDTETTGVSFRKDELTQIAAARLEHGEVTEWFVTFVNPGKPIPEEITHLTNISDSDVEDAPGPTEALERLVEFVGDAKLVAHNAQFDRTFVTKHPAGYALLDNQWIDSLELARIVLPRMRSHRLIDLVTAFDAPLSTHRADDDVVATCALYRILLAGIVSLPLPLISEISSFYDPLSWPYGRVFQYFFEQKYDEIRMDFGDSEALPSDAVFSLIAMRKKRTGEMKFISKPKTDAATILTKKQVDALEASPIKVSSDSGIAVRTMEYPDAGEIETAFSPGGLIGTIYDDFEVREPQLSMAEAVNQAFTDSENLVVEAGTGTGKSMAYLVPSALLAIANDIGVGVATKTNALLDQLVYKELPALSSAMMESGRLDRPLVYVPLKGFTHYPCLLKVDRILRHGPQMRNVANEEMSQAPALAALLSYLEQTVYDDMDGLKIDYRVLPKGSVTTNSHECLRQRCPFFGEECFVFGRRKQAEYADIVVTNHSLFFYDTVLDNALLPPLRYWIVDEAHSVEEDARKALSLTLSIDELKYICGRLVSGEPRNNPMISAERALEDGAKVIEALVSKARSTAVEFEETLMAFEAATKGLLYFDSQKRSSYDTFDLWINEDVRASGRFADVTAAAREMAGRMEKIVGVLQDIVVLLDDEQKARTAQRAIASMALQLKEAVQAADGIFVSPGDSYVYSVTLNRREPKGRNRAAGNSYHAELYDIGSALDETLYENTHSVVYTSATLAVDGSIESFEHSVGLNADERSKARFIELDPCFDFDANMKVIVVSDIAEPNMPSYLSDLQRLLEGVHVSQNGSVLTLFTNKKDMDACYDHVSDALMEHGLRLMAQRRGVSIKGIRDEFIKDKSLSLFALKSFWEGFDAPGDTLRSVVIPRLPFSNPNDPLSKERGSRDDSAWRHYDLPKAVIELRQAAGRLIRKADDRGALILCDSRLLTKGYGRTFISSLPSSNVQVLSIDEAIAELGE